jgi:basic membrane lipoprotein Med (substrate-binding protein (PBP1-ABC) superfamily)
MADGMVRLILNPQLADRIPSAVLQKVHSAEQAIINGKIVLPSR